MTSIGEYAFDSCPTTLEIHGVSGSAAESYAIEHGFTFVSESAASLDAFCDLNADYTVNASDAACILIYAAAVGAGYEGTLPEYFAAK